MAFSEREREFTFPKNPRNCRMCAQVAINIKEERRCDKMPLHKHNVQSFACGVSWWCKFDMYRP